MNLDFESLFRQALKNWPNKIDLSTLQYATLDIESYTIKGLGKISNEIKDKCVGTKMEVITRTLQGALYSVIHATAKTVLKLECSSIRPS
ncbi:hypothetical protein QN379_05690 [Glaciimonas sp. Gout2]|nr:hypothetical protein [Glaciimonas sp. Cout2]MEB0013529.1 hypothetical protein [Glaciimonas sp. Cout2]MEB0081505.1 hypothetical protein [Glaciimonas sp. Gout2]